MPIVPILKAERDAMKKITEHERLWLGTLRPYYRTPKHNHPYLTGDPATRRCIKCGIVQNKDLFLTKRTKKQIERLSTGGNCVPGIDLANGKFMRGYFRPRRFNGAKMQLGQLCPACRTPKRILPPTFVNVINQIKRKGDDLRGLRYRALRDKSLEAEQRAEAIPGVPNQKAARLAYADLGLRLLAIASNRARRMRREANKRKDRRGALHIPARWELLLDPQHRVSLSARHAAVFWRDERMTVF